MTVTIPPAPKVPTVAPPTAADLSDKIVGLEATPLEDSDLLGDALTDAAKVRFPSLEGLAPREKIGALEDHTVLTAQVEADLSRLRLICQRKLQEAEEEWEGISGWEAFLRRPGRDATAADRDRAKGQVDPHLWAMIRACRFVIPRCTEEIARMERDTKRASRIYSFITGS